MTKIQELAKLNQSIWLDFIRRSYLKEGGLKRLVAQGLGGVTSNPTIFEKAIAGSSDYDDAMKNLVEANKSVEEIYETLAIEDIRMAADQLRDVYDRTAGKDGFVSLEVDPTLAYETERTISEAKRFYTTVDRPNVMIKVPATPAGIPAITELIGSGVNVNVTLIFSLSSYRDVAYAYIKGLEKLSQNGPSVRGGHGVDRVASVASFFVSRVDSAVDDQLKELGNTTLLGKIAIANSKLAYHSFKKIFSGERWEILEKQGARYQRPLWASTSTKNPEYPDTLYVDSLIGPHTVNTVPPKTLDAFIDHGVVSETLGKDVDQARNQMAELRELGVDFDAITQKLQDDGVVSFARSFESLMSSVAEKRNRLLGENRKFHAHLGKYEAVVETTAKRLIEEDILKRIWRHDYTVWKNSPEEITDRLGWLDSPEVMSDAVSEIDRFVDKVRAEGFSQALLLGMGGSSLAPEVFRMTFGVKEGYLDLSVLDSTDPATVLEKEQQSRPGKTLYIVSTKSGGTAETLSFMKYFYNKTIETLGAEKAGEQFIAITDPGSALEKLAKKLNFRKIFLNDPNIGGRYSALSYFGLVPAALIGINIHKLLERASLVAEVTKNGNDMKTNIPAYLGIIMGELTKAGRDKLTFITTKQTRPFGAWVEQLIAESTGKDGKGILPVVTESNGELANYANDRLFVELSLDGDDCNHAFLASLSKSGHPVMQIKLKDLYDLGGEFFQWEIATAIAGWSIKINPFDQPNVEFAKKSARKMIVEYQESGQLPALTPTLSEDSITVYADFSTKRLSDALSHFLGMANVDNRSIRSYVALQAYVKPDSQADAALQEISDKIREKYKLAVTIGYGPRFLHSTGQLHKGDAGNGLFIQFTTDTIEDVAIPDQPGFDFSAITFGVLLKAQSLGDRQALLDAGRKVIRINLGQSAVPNLRKIAEMI